MLAKKEINRVIVFMMFAFFLIVSASFAQDRDEVSELKEQIKALQERIERLEAEKKNFGNFQDDYFRRGWGFDWDPFERMDRMQEHMSRMFQDSFRGHGLEAGAFSSQLSFNDDFDLKEDKNGYEIRFDLAGLNNEKIDIEINEHSVTVKGEYSRQDTEESPDRYYSAKKFGSFMKTIPLPTDADTTKAKTQKNGDTLVITMPKKKI